MDALPTLVARLALALWGRRLPPLLASLGALRSSGHLSALLADRSPFPLGSSLRLWGRHHRIGRLGCAGQLLDLARIYRHVILRMRRCGMGSKNIHSWW